MSPASTELTDDELLEALGAGDTDGSEITALKHVRTAAGKLAAEEIAQRTACEDFEEFKPLFQRVETEICSGLAQTQPITAENCCIGEKDVFILNGVTLHVSEMGEPLKITASEMDRRLRHFFPTARRVTCCCGPCSKRFTMTLQHAVSSGPVGSRR